MSERPVSEAQLQANRANAKKSTGPTTDEGKAKSRFNATRHNLTGQVRIQTPADMDAYFKFTEAVVNELDPQGPIETNLAQSIADAQWRLSRAPAHEESILVHDVITKGDRYILTHPSAHAGMVQSVAFFERSKEFANISLYEQRLNNQMHKNLKLLMQMKKDRLLRKSPEEVKVMAASAGYEPEDAPETAQAESTTYPENGFVLSTAVSAAKPEPETPAPDLQNAA